MLGKSDIIHLYILHLYHHVRLKVSEIYQKLEG